VAEVLRQGETRSVAQEKRPSEHSAAFSAAPQPQDSSTLVAPTPVTVGVSLDSYRCQRTGKSNEPKDPRFSFLGRVCELKQPP
jgi:hypothetical protein